MEVYLRNITGYDEALQSMYMSKRTWTPELMEQISLECDSSLNKNGRITTPTDSFTKRLNTLFKWGQVHPTMLRFMDFSFIVEGIHRGAQDDWDSHAKRFDNRIIRSSTRLADFNNEKSEYYKEKILTLDEVLNLLNVDLPNEFESNCKEYVRTTNGYILKSEQNNKDVKRGLYPLSIPSNFICKVNIPEFAHCVKERDINSNAAPELKEMVEELLNQLHDWCPYITREYLYDIKQ